MLADKKYIEQVLTALAEQLEAGGLRHLELVVCGGAAMNVAGFVSRATRDVDVVAFVDHSEEGTPILIKATPMREALIKAAERVQKDFNLPDNWINSGPSSVMDFGLPQGLMKRVETRQYGSSLTIHFLGRLDQIHFKLHAAVDQSGGKHYDDLKALKPSSDEIEQAAKWSMQHDPSEGYKTVLKDFLEKTGFEDVAKRI